MGEFGAGIPGAGRPIVIELPPQSAYLVLIRHFICSIAQHMGFESADVHQIELAIDEACSNSIRAIQEREGPGAHTMLRLEITPRHDAIDIVVVDNGACFSEHFDRHVQLDELVARFQTGGYGLQIIKTCMDDVYYEHVPEQGNRLQLTKKLN